MEFYEINFHRFLLLFKLVTKKSIFKIKIMCSDCSKFLNHKDLDEFQIYHLILSFLLAFTIV